MRQVELDDVVRNRTLSEVVDLLKTLHIENRNSVLVVSTLLRYFRATGLDNSHPTAMRLLEVVRDTSAHCCRVIDGPC